MHHSSLSRHARTLLLATLVGAPAGAAFAQMTPEAAPPSPEQQAAASRGERQAAMQFKMLDANGDGFLSRDEVALFPRLRDAFDLADTDRDGKVSFAEIRTLALQRRAERAEAPGGATPAPAPAPTPTPLPAPAPDAVPVLPPAPPAEPPKAATPPIAPPAATPPPASPPATEPAKKRWWWPF